MNYQFYPHSVPNTKVSAAKNLGIKGASIIYDRGLAGEQWRTSKFTFKNLGVLKFKN